MALTSDAPVLSVDHMQFEIESPMSESGKSSCASSDAAAWRCCGSAGGRLVRL